MGKFLNLIDFTSVEARIYTKGMDRYTTNFGAFMSIFTAFGVLTFLIYFVYGFLSGIGMNVLYYSQEVGKVQFNYNLYDRPVLLDLNTFDGTNVFQVDPRYLTFVPTYLNWSQTTNIYNTTTLELESCAYGQNIDPKWTDKFGDISGFQCFKKSDNVKLSSDIIGNYLIYLNIYVQKCQNTTLNNNSCFPLEEIDNFLKTKSIYFDYQYATNKIDHYNKTHPVQDSFFLNTFIINPEFQFVFYENIKQVNYTTDFGSVFEDISTITSYGRDPTSIFSILPSSQKRVKDQVAWLQISPNSYSLDKYKRSYQKLQAVVANVGGALKLLMTVAQIISKFVTSQMFFLDLSRFFKEKEDKKEKQNESRTNKPIIEINNNFIVNEPSSRQKHKVTDAMLKKLASSKERRRMTTWEAIVPFYCQKRNTTKQISSKNEKMIKKFLSSEVILKMIVENEKLKSVLLTENQQTLFRLTSNYTAREMTNLISTPNKVNDNTNEIIVKEMGETNRTSKVLVERLINDCD